MAYISVTDAVARTGKGQTTIYRLCRKHEHTKHVRREDKKFLIDEDFLAEHYAETENGQASNNEAEPQRQELVDLFIQELLNEKRYYQQLLDRKDEQLARKDTMIINLQERQREIMDLLEHYSELLEITRQPPAPAPVPSPEPAPVALSQPESFTEEHTSNQVAENAQPVIYEARTVYTVLAFVILLLSLAIVFVDEIRGLVEN